jgi:hypothetical protein
VPTLLELQQVFETELQNYEMLSVVQLVVAKHLA